MILAIRDAGLRFCRPIILVGAGIVLVAAAPPISMVKFTGPLSHSSVDALISHVTTSGVREVDIASYGGSEEAGLRLGAFLRSRHITVIVSKACLSACAQYILMPAHKAIVRDGALIGFHHSAYAIHRWAAGLRQPGLRSQQILKASRELSQATVQALSPWEREILTRSLASVGPRCLAPPIVVGGTPRLKMRANFWVPSRKLLSAAGIETPENWPSSAPQALELARKYMKPNIVVVYGMGLPPFDQPLKDCKE